ncbi:MAG: hypothetical protein ACK4HQ_03125 [Brevinematales bacterium]
MKTCFVMPHYTELGELREKMVLLPGLGNGVFSIGDAISVCDRLVIDLTFDWFRPEINPISLLSFFADLYEYFAMPGVEKVVFRGYRLETNDPLFQKTQQVFEGLVALMKEIFGLKEVKLPTIVSKQGLIGSRHPLLLCLASMRAGVSKRIGWSGSSEVYVAYEMDVLSWLGEFCTRREMKCGVVGGERYTLKEVVERTEVIFSLAAVTFDSHRWFRYGDEGKCMECFFSYGIENMAMDLLY